MLRSPLLSGEIRRARPPAAKRSRLPLLGFRSLIDPAPAGGEGRQIRDLGGSSRRIWEQRAAPCSRRSGTSATGQGRWRQTPALLCFIDLDGFYSAKDVSYRSRTSYLLISRPGLGLATAPTTVIPVMTRQGSAMTSVTFSSCGYCGYTLNLSSSTRNTANIGSKYGKQIRKGAVSSSRFFVLCPLKSMVATIPNFLFLFDLDLDATGALLLRMFGGVSGAAVLLEATGVMAGVYGGDHKLSRSSTYESRPSSTTSSWAKGASSAIGFLRPDRVRWCIMACGGLFCHSGL
ncbi:hypothetical protein VPH35_028669 [Triticum aestivum]